MLLSGVVQAASVSSAGSCYFWSSHAITCNVTQQSCLGSLGVWYAPGYISARSACCHCEASCANVSASCTYHDMSSPPNAPPMPQAPAIEFGCYNENGDHQCNCTSSEALCQTPPGAYFPVWTSG
eukprot:7379787-Prymnesium_polylepis.2